MLLFIASFALLVLAALLVLISDGRQSNTRANAVILLGMSGFVTLIVATFWNYVSAVATEPPFTEKVLAALASGGYALATVMAVSLTVTAVLGVKMVTTR